LGKAIDLGHVSARGEDVFDRLFATVLNHGFDGLLGLNKNHRTKTSKAGRVGGCRPYTGVGLKVEAHPKLPTSLATAARSRNDGVMTKGGMMQGIPQNSPAWIAEGARKQRKYAKVKREG